MIDILPIDTIRDDKTNGLILTSSSVTPLSAPDTTSANIDLSFMDIIEATIMDIWVHYEDSMRKYHDPTPMHHKYVSYPSFSFFHNFMQWRHCMISMLG